MTSSAFFVLFAHKNLITFLRTTFQYPHLVYGAIASSAPVRAQTNFQGYNHVVGRSFADPVVGGSQKVPVLFKRQIQWKNYSLKLFNVQ